MTRLATALRRITYLACLAGLLTAPAWGQETIVEYCFDGETVQPTAEATGIDASDFQISSGSVTFGSTGTWDGCGTPYAQGSGGWTATAPGTGKHFFFDVDEIGGTTFTIDEISFWYARTPAGPEFIAVYINNTQVYDAAALNGPVELAIDVSAFEFEDLSTANIEIYGYVDGVSGTGDFRLNEVTISGSVDAPDNPTLFFTESSDSIDEGDTATLTVELENDASETVTVDVVLVQGDPEWFTPAYTAQNVEFVAPATDGETRNVNVTAIDNVVVTRTAVFELQNIDGGPDAFIGSPSQFTLTIEPELPENLELMSYWHFNDPVVNGNAWPQPVMADFGRGEITYTFGNTETFGGSTLNARLGEPAGGSFTLRGGTGQENNGESFQLEFSTVGFENLVLRYALQATSTGFDSRFHEFSTDGGTSWTAIHDHMGTPGSYTLVELNLSGFEDLNDAGDVILRVTVDDASGATGRNSFDNITLEGNLLATARVADGLTGWRMLSAPLDGVTVQHLANLSLVQGIPGEYPLASCPNTNLFTGYNGDADDTETGTPGEDFCTIGGFTVPSGLGDALVPGRGFIWHLWEDAFDPNHESGESTSAGLPLVIAAPGTPLGATHDVVFTGAQRAGDADDWFLIGNPFDEPLLLSNMEVSEGTMATTVAHWDPNEGAAGEYVFLSTIGDKGNDPDEAQVWDGFFAEIVGHGLPDEDLIVTFCREECPGGTSEPPLVSQDVVLVFAGEFDDREISGSTRIVFASDASEEWDRHDLSVLYPRGSKWALLTAMGDRFGEHVPKFIESRPMPGEETVSIPVAFSALDAGSFTISLGEQTTAPESWTIQLEDTVTGQVVDLRQGSFSFSVSELVWMDERFLVHVAGQPIATDPGSGEYAFELAAAYPNPLSSSATIAFTLPESSDVALTVYDVLGRRVAVLADGEHAAGPHTVTLDGNGLASGVYVVRLVAGEHSASRRVTVVR